ncbi:MAG: TetR/AcrR family transcriptional regulator [Sideroxyarcus sp.]|nr:TetR/AcrR family transcriptional regulator [Sideroxyarcus sp.]
MKVQETNKRKSHTSEPLKGDATKAAILTAALEVAEVSGLQGITIGVLAEKTGMSKSGVFAHFKAREELLVEVVREYHRRFEQIVFEPAMSQPKGLPRLKQMIATWLDITSAAESTGSVFITGPIEFDDQPGLIRDALVQSVEIWRQALLRSINESIQLGHLKDTADPDVILFQIYSYVLGVHHDVRFLHVDKSLATAKKLIEEMFSHHLNNQ